MAANTDKLTANYNVKLYKGTLITGTVNEAAAETITSVSANQVTGIRELGELSKERNIIDIPTYGQETSRKLPGQIDPGTFDFSCAWDFSSAQQKSIRDDSGKTEYSWVLVFPGATGTDYAVFDGYVANGTIGLGIDGETDLSASIARTGNPTWLTDATA